MGPFFCISKISLGRKCIKTERITLRKEGRKENTQYLIKGSMEVEIEEPNSTRNGIEKKISRRIFDILFQSNQEGRKWILNLITMIFLEYH